MPLEPWQEPLVFPGGARLKNRVALTAHTYGFVDYTGCPLPTYAQYIQRVAMAGAGLVIAGESHVGGSALFGYEPWGEHVVGESSRPHYEALSRVQQSTGCQIAEQLFHPGLQVWPSRHALAVGVRSGSAPLAGTPGRRVAREEWSSIQQAFRAAAFLVSACGLGIEVKADQGKLLDDLAEDSVISSESRDAFLAILGDVSSVGASFVGLRVRAEFAGTAGGHALIAEAVDTFEFDYVSISSGSNSTAQGYISGHAADEDMSAVRVDLLRARSFGRVKTIRTGAFTSFEEANAELLAGRADVIGLTRAQIADSELLRIENPHPARPCTRCNQGCVGNTFEGREVRCTFNAFSGRPELDRFRGGLLASGDTSKRVAVIGGGVSGCESAIQLASRGASVRLFERRPNLLGSIQMAALLPGHAGLWRIIQWYEAALAYWAVEVELSSIPSVFALDGYDLVVQATGFDPPVGPAMQVVSLTAALCSKGALDGWTDVIVFDSVWARGGLGVASVLAEQVPVLYMTPFEKVGGLTDVATVGRWMSTFRASGGRIELRSRLVIDGQALWFESDVDRSRWRVGDTTLVVTDDPTIWGNCPSSPGTMGVEEWFPAFSPGVRSVSTGDLDGSRGCDHAVRNAAVLAAGVCQELELARKLMKG